MYQKELNPYSSLLVMMYLAGYRDINGDSMASYWENGVATALANDSVPAPEANSIYVSGTDIYVAGESIVNGNSVATYWKNGIPTYLSSSDDNAYANSIYINGNDVYIAGEIYYGFSSASTAIYWKNDQKFDLQAVITTHSIFVSGQDIYIAGQQFVPVGTYAATYWENGIPNNLTLEGSIANSICVDNNNNTLVSGVTDSACFWKNGTITKLSGGSFGAYVFSIFAYNDDIYVVGFEDNDFYSAATYWKNGKPIILNSTQVSSIAYSIFVK
jgi:hypothetical protein